MGTRLRVLSPMQSCHLRQSPPYVEVWIWNLGQTSSTTSSHALKFTSIRKRLHRELKPFMTKNAIDSILPPKKREWILLVPEFHRELG